MKLAIAFVAIVSFILVACKSGSSGSTDDKEWKTISSSPNLNENYPLVSEENNNSGKFTTNLPTNFENPTDDVGKRMLKEYGAVFVARGDAVAPNVVVFKDAGAVSAFQAGAKSTTESFGSTSITLQEPAMRELKDAIAEANQSGVSITPRGSDAAKRTYEGTVDLWKSRVEPGLTHWVGEGRISATDAKRIRTLSPFEQVPEIFKLESQRIYFSKDLSKSIIYSVAPPGTSQHLSMLAFDVAEHENTKVRSKLAEHGWYQTVVSDLPHFTFLGVKETELTGLGLKRIESGERIYWIPDL